MIHSNKHDKGITKALIRLRGCAGCSAPLLFAKPRRQVFLRRSQHLAWPLALSSRKTTATGQKKL